VVVNFCGDRFVSPCKFWGGRGMAFAGGPDKRACLLGGAIAGWVIWATKAAALFTEVAIDDVVKPFIVCCRGSGWVGKMA